MSHQPTLVRNIYIPAAIILVTNILGALHLLPVFPQLLLNSCAVVYLGCIAGTRIKQTQKGYHPVQGETGDQETIGMKQAMKFPLVASAFLFGIYLIYKIFDANLVTLLITSYFCITTMFSTAELVGPLLPVPENWKDVFTTIKVPGFIKKNLDMGDLDLSIASCLSLGLVAIPVYFYFMTKHWTLNNVFGILFSVMALKLVNLGSFKVGILLLWALFFYDIFWVYGTDVMVSVAKNLDIPIKLLFPYLNSQGVEKYSMLGLGDIVLPGIFISLCLKYDIDRSIQGISGPKPKSPKDFKLTYFTTCFIGYILGICETFAALLFFEHAQPALLFLVPMCTLSVLLVSAIKKEIKPLFQFNNEKLTEEDRIHIN